ncbi:16S rRNA (cytidine(1402)-2'-O)-methyltransferase [Salinimonas marina]|uniref:Ribosomal RNA small subunit methyltransferase I n=1 Tax=Salinimonas marina TaxID=2785918 RepID=A0A7S9DYJ9_9ALTE|nr:16S rRNA (cytidine(1402)-2'-O)-methyltransferase [Salinimonas marina]QPG06240.1 16S rRNA (cytidine(1402)-2'-O)-methyltransferase [Salinimonas marina]
MSDDATLYIVPTPIGNLDDITARALQTLESVDWIAAEDTRHTQRLLQHFGIKTRTMSLHEHNEDKRATMLVHRLQSGESVALVSDAGTPLISDPGFVLVRKCREEHIKVVALPGPCAAITALSGSGLPTDRFIFEGFLPSRSQARSVALKQLSDRTCTSVFYEAPRRIRDTLLDIQTVLGASRALVLAKELSKSYEAFVSGTAKDIIDWLDAEPGRQKGEFVLMIGGAERVESDLPAPALELLAQLTAELPLKKAAAIVAAHYKLKKNALYQAGLERNNAS